MYEGRGDRGGGEASRGQGTEWFVLSPDAR